MKQVYINTTAKLHKEIKKLIKIMSKKKTDHLDGSL